MKVFRMNDCDCWMAETKEQAVADYRKHINEDPEYSEDVSELTDEELDRKRFCFWDCTDAELESIREQFRAVGVEMGADNRVTIRQEFNRLISLGNGSQFFSSTEH